MRPTGDLDAESCADLRRQLSLCFASGVRHVVIDLGEVTSVGLPGLQLLDGVHGYLSAQGGALAVIHASASVERSLRVNDLGSLLELNDAQPRVAVGGMAQLIHLEERRRPAAVPTADSGTGA